MNVLNRATRYRSLGRLLAVSLSLAALLVAAASAAEARPAGVNLSLGRGAARVHILKDIGLHIGAGEAVGLVGPSGSGKSTLLMVAAGLERPDTGKKSTGLGLNFVNEVAALHGGAAAVSNLPDRGLRARLTLPAA